jgi:hypothetical protein
MEMKFSFVGKMVLIRSNMAGVFVGKCLQHEGNTVVLENTHRLWSWTAVKGVSLSSVAMFGTKDGKIEPFLGNHWINDVIEIMEVSQTALVAITV